MKYLTFLISLFGLSMSLFSQSLFESALSSGSPDEKNFEINGFVRSDVFANEIDIRSVYGETSLRIETKSFQFGNAYSEFRIKQNLLEPNQPTSVDFREGYIKLYLSDFDFRIGQQVIAWGRADGFNPTNNLTPHDFTVFSPDEDDKRLSNFAFSGIYNFNPFKLNIVWIPLYKSSVLPFKKASLPEGVSWCNEDFPESQLSQSNVALKLTIEKASFDGSLSWFNGYHKLPGLKNQSIDNLSSQVFLTTHRTNIFGFDFSTTFGNYGLRGEFAYSHPKEQNDSLHATPLPQIEYTIGLDKEWGNFSLIVQYIGKYVSDFNEHNGLVTDFSSQLSIWNDMIYGQQNEYSHTASIRPSLSLVHQTLNCEVLSLYNFTTQELFFKPKITYKLSDNLSLTAGAQYYYGIENTLFEILSKGLNAGFLECKINF
ncbi:hypothetical protein L21SP5_03180 [Salinivirga cyanobacteriivorans]|uniref:Phosphate-selective porin n=1 Tax=Salinivirga cyanobacteriivorans TaxID=1307839 RepID=A0A0S2I3N7_9BACT|nr:DUF1302 family protein [Salinivirga cyanobacteriivorans]ALO16795.1 hypothetical protein L21SP5_03180 [Salinivirga cyanobacteriivorans]